MTPTPHDRPTDSTVPHSATDPRARALPGAAPRPLTRPPLTVERPFRPVDTA